MEQNGTHGADLSIVQLSAWYGQAQALFDVSLHVVPGAIAGMVGRNGAGKSTLLRTIARLHRRAAGVLALDGAGILAERPDRIAARGVSLVREGAHVFANLSVAEHLQLAERLAALRNREPRGMDEVLEMFPVLGERMKHSAGYLSGGQRQILALAMAFRSQPSLLLLDEPSAGLARTVATTVFDSIGRMARQGMTLIIAEQEPAWLEGLVDRMVTLETGRFDGGMA
jgi:branched-chain amino acid transport system ATP-binding protein